MCFLQLRKHRFILALFENNMARVFDATTLEIVQELNFKSDYALPKPSQINGQKKIEPKIVTSQVS
jgi:hypothetical protein